MILDQSLFFGMADIYDRHRDMRLDVDNMSYEVRLIQTYRTRYFTSFCCSVNLLVCQVQELLALEERIGNVNTGLSEETIVARLKRTKHVNAPEPQVEEEPCCVCQVSTSSYVFICIGL